MQFKVVALSFLASLAAAEDLKELVASMPGCAVPCLDDAAKGVGCSVDDWKCKCKKSNELAAQAVACVSLKCSDDEVDKTTKLTSEICLQVMKDSGSEVANDARDQVEETSEDVKEKASEAAEKTGEAFDDAADKAGDAFEDFAEKADDAVGDAADKTGDAIGDATDKAGEAIEKTSDDASEAVSNALDGDDSDESEPEVDSAVRIGAGMRLVGVALVAALAL